MIVINIQKAFNSINHKIMLQKLKAIRFSTGNYVQWFRSYFSERIFDWFAYNKLTIYILERARLNRSILQGNKD